MTYKNLGLVASVGLVTVLYGVSPAWAQVAVSPNLGTAAPYTVLGTTAVTCTTSTINGSVGTGAASITNTGPCTISGAIDTSVAVPVSDFNAAKTAIATQNASCTGDIPTATTTLAPGVYCSAAPANAGTTIGAGVTLTLNGNASDVWVFRVGASGLGALTLNSTQVVMGGTAQACNVYWKTEQAATLTDSTFVGTILSGTAVTMTRGSWTGRAMATTFVTTTDAAPLTFAGCSAPASITVNKDFIPNSVATVPVALTCTSGTVTTTPLNASEAAPAVFTVGGASLGGATCTATETVPAGYTANQASCASVALNGNCTITNTSTSLPTVTKAFSPSSNGPGGVSTLTITLTNNNATAATLTAALVDSLPAGVVIAATPSASTTCGGGAVTATAGGSSITLATGATIPGGAPGSCRVIANVTSATAGTYTNTIAANALQTSNGNNAAAASAVLTIDAATAAVPTLPEWAMIALVALLCLGGFFAIRRRRMTD